MPRTKKSPTPAPSASHPEDPQDRPVVINTVIPESLHRKLGHHIIDLGVSQREFLRGLIELALLDNEVT